MREKLVFLCAIYMFLGCNGNSEKNVKGISKSVLHTFENIFGEKYSALGTFASEKNKDSVEDDLWQFTNLSHPMVVYGKYANGIQIGEWKFGLSNNQILSSTWNPYSNHTLGCEFSVPFYHADTLGNKYLLKLAGSTDSLGKITIIVGVSDTAIKDQDLDKFGTDSESGLREQGFTFTRTRREFSCDSTKYIFTEYFMKDASGKDVKLYNLYGYTPSHKDFVQFTLFHNGPHDDLVKIIYNLMVESLYIGNERFLNPYLR